MTPTKTALALMKERNLSTCQVEGCGNPAQEAHHCLYGNRKKAPKQLRDQLNDPRNLQLVCRECHKFTGKAKTYENKLKFWEWGCRFYGHDKMVRWHEELLLKVKEKGYK